MIFKLEKFKIKLTVSAENLIALANIVLVFQQEENVVHCVSAFNAKTNSRKNQKIDLTNNKR
jgi:hypothetical protein